MPVIPNRALAPIDPIRKPKPGTLSPTAVRDLLFPFLLRSCWRARLPPPLFFVSVASKGVAREQLRLISAKTRRPAVSVAPKGVTAKEVEAFKIEDLEKRF
jgi:hypothetical protein